MSPVYFQMYAWTHYLHSNYSRVLSWPEFFFWRSFTQRNWMVDKHGLHSIVTSLLYEHCYPSWVHEIKAFLCHLRLLAWLFGTVCPSFRSWIAEHHKTVHAWRREIKLGDGSFSRTSWFDKQVDPFCFQRSRSTGFDVLARALPSFQLWTTKCCCSRRHFR